MPIKGTVVKDWGKIVPVNKETHVTQTNRQSYDGYAVHSTTNIPGTGMKCHDRFDSKGNYLGSDVVERG